MIFLVLDTSSKYLSLAVAEDNKVLAQMHRLLDRKHSLQLVPLIELILKKVKVPLPRLDGLCVGRGPGSFTGLRIGITCVKGLAFVLRKPVAAISSLDILAQNASRERNRRFSDSGRKIARAEMVLENTQICPIVDAKQNKVYAAVYQSKNGRLRRQSKYLLLEVEELLKRLQGEIIFLGDGLKNYSRNIRQAKKIRPALLEEEYWYPQASRAIPLGYERLLKGKVADADRLVPLYLYPKECQIRNRPFRANA